MLTHRQRRWPNIETTQGQCHVFAGGGGGGAHGANRSVTIQPDKGVTDLIVCIYTMSPALVQCLVFAGTACLKLSLIRGRDINQGLHFQRNIYYCKILYRYHDRFGLESKTSASFPHFQTPIMVFS